VADGATDGFVAEIVGLDEAGAGIADLAHGDEVLRVHVAGALPGERVDGRITYRSVHGRGGRREAWAALENVQTPSPDRVAPACPVYGACGGCSLMHLAYPAQLAWKRARVRDELARVPELAASEVAPCVPSPSVLGYRNQAKYVYVLSPQGSPVLGAYAPRSHDVVDLGGCSVVEPVLDQARQALLDVLSEFSVEPYHEVQRIGVLRYVLLRANGAGKVLATLVVARPDWRQANAVAESFLAKAPSVIRVVLNVNTGSGNTLLGESERTLVGASTFEDQIGEARVRLGSRSFFQANRAVGGRIYRDLVAQLPNDLGRAVDAYAGAGGIAVSLLARSREVIAIESNAAATQAASEQLPPGLRMITGDAAQGLATLDVADVVVVNPPRKGCSGEVVAQIRRLSPRFVGYVSCDPASLARDLGLLAADFTVASVIPYDMMPHTPHVETLVVLRRR
jgi:23S rRNA (uracil1939-C5)-methyltransferase